ncbi:L-fucose/L-arabinose isomerase family protein [Streptomyces sp. B6B3]|uniref:L-fucose/L-arabinose isomerase family protein n=1 Tax=Streptomyces sp. B6B3 TaxID=3153570 RepID=UPI00325E9495
MSTTPVVPPPPLSRVPLTPARIGLVSGGLGNYWPQFPDLLPTLRKSADHIRDHIAATGAHVEDAGFVSDPVEGAAAAERLRRADCDLIVVFVATYMTSAQVLPVFRYGGAPILLVNLQPAPAMDHATFDTGDWLGYAGFAGLPEIGVALERLNLPVRSVSGHLADDRAWARIDRWVRAAGVLRALRTARHGMMGHLYPGMFDIATNITALTGTVGGHVEILEFDDLKARFDRVTDADTDRLLATVEQVFEIHPGADRENVRFQARVAAALDRLVDDYGLATLAYFYFGEDDTLLQRLAAGFAVGATLLSSRGIPTVTEYEVRAAAAMYVLDQFGAGGTLTEGQALNFDDGVCEIGHNDAADMAITARPPLLRSLDVYHGKSGGGVSVEVDIARGPVTQFSLGELHDGRLRFIASEGEVVPGPLLRIGNTTSRVDFGCDPADWADAWARSGSTHHWAMGVGHRAADIEALADLVGAEYVRVQP